MGTINSQNGNSSVSNLFEKSYSVFQCGVGRTCLVKKVSSYNHEIWSQLDGSLHYLREYPVKISPSVFQSVLGITEVEIAGMYKAEGLQTSAFSPFCLSVFSRFRLKCFRF